LFIVGGARLSDVTARRLGRGDQFKCGHVLRLMAAQADMSLLPDSAGCR
jgi:hypothetical protein